MVQAFFSRHQPELNLQANIRKSKKTGKKKTQLIVCLKIIYKIESVLIYIWHYRICGDGINFLLILFV